MNCNTSFPKGIPEPSAAVRPTVLAMRVGNVKYSFRTTPRIMVFISEIPEPKDIKFYYYSDLFD